MTFVGRDIEGSVPVRPTSAADYIAHPVGGRDARHEPQALRGVIYTERENGCMVHNSNTETRAGCGHMVCGRGEASKSSGKTRVQGDVVGPNTAFTPPGAAPATRAEKSINQFLLHSRHERGRPEDLRQHYRQEDDFVRFHVSREAGDSLRQVAKQVGGSSAGWEARNAALDRQAQMLNRRAGAPYLSLAKVLLESKQGVAPLGGSQGGGGCRDRLHSYRPCKGKVLCREWTASTLSKGAKRRQGNAVSKGRRPGSRTLHLLCWGKGRLAQHTPEGPTKWHHERNLRSDWAHQQCVQRNARFGDPHCRRPS